MKLNTCIWAGSWNRLMYEFNYIAYCIEVHSTSWNLSSLFRY